MLFEFTVFDWIGILGSLIIAAAYLAVSGGRINAEHPTFQLLNLMGALLVLTSLYFRPNPGAILIEVLWTGIAIFTLFRFFRRRK